MTRKYFFLISAAAIFFQGCQSIAYISDFSTSARNYDFNKIANSKLEGKGSKTESEYYIKTNLVEDSLIANSIIQGLKSEGFTIKVVESNDRAILAERGARANEWNSVTGVYYQKNSDGFEIYIRCKITQDITGGWREDRARKIGDKICSFLKNCAQSYSVSRI